jgi:hypothetical protein
LKKSDIGILPGYYGLYIDEVENIELSDALKEYCANMFFPDKTILENIGDRVYSHGKWTVREILQHLIDSERIFCYRALTFARKDRTELPGFEENDYAPASKAGRRSVSDLLSELESVRMSSIFLFESFDDEMLKAEGVCSERVVSVLSIGFVLAGHFFHHYKVLKEKYYPLLS